MRKQKKEAEGMVKKFKDPSINSINHVNSLVVIAISIMAAVYGIVFGIQSMMVGKFILALVDLSIAAFFICMIIWGIVKPGRKAQKWVLVIVTLLFFLYLYISGGIESTGVLWSLIVPLCTVSLLGKRNGIILSAVYIFISIGIYMTYKESLPLPSADFMQRVIGIYIILTIVAIAYEYSNEVTNKILRKEVESRIYAEEEAERNRIELELIDSKEQYLLLFDNMNEGFALHEMIYDEGGNPRDYRFLDVNRAFEKLTGLRLQDIKGKGVMEVLPETEAFWVERYNQVTKTGSAQRFESYSQGLDKYFSINVYPVDEIRFAVTFFDITERKKIELALYEEKESFRTTLYSVGDGVISIDRRGHIKLINKVAEDITGWKKEEAIGKPLERVFKLFNPETGEGYEDLIKDVINTGKAIELGESTLLISKKGSKIPIEDSAAPIMDKDGSINGVVIVFRDFSEKKERQERIEYLSYHDQLTGLYNRRFFEEELRRLDTERNLPITLVMADVNGLKLANDAFGHAVGDELLKTAARAIKGECRGDDISARIGGDEFILLLPKTSYEEAEKIVERIKEKVTRETVGAIIVSVSFGWATKDNGLQEMNEIFKRAEDSMYKRKLFESPSMRGNMIHSMVNTLNSKNQTNEEHIKSLDNICKKITRVFNLEEEEARKFQSAWLLHDIGKIAIDDKIMNKSGKLDGEEWEELKRHPEIGYRILSSVNEFAEIAEYVLAHHERWDGRGYPKGLAGEEIPWMARLLAIADAYDDMLLEKPYRPAMDENEAIEEIRKNAGSQFDPQLAKIFIEEVLEREW